MSPSWARLVTIWDLVLTVESIMGQRAQWRDLQLITRCCDCSVHVTDVMSTMLWWVWRISCYCLASKPLIFQPFNTLPLITTAIFLTQWLVDWLIDWISCQRLLLFFNIDVSNWWAVSCLRCFSRNLFSSRCFLHKKYFSNFQSEHMHKLVCYVYDMNCVKQNRDRLYYIYTYKNVLELWSKVHRPRMDI